VCHVADALGLVGNSLDCNRVSTNKHLMRRAFERGGDPSPKSVAIRLAQEGEADAAADAVIVDPNELDTFDPASLGLQYPLIVKPVDRSGSRGITKVYRAEELGPAIEHAKSQGFVKQALVEEFAEGKEYSAECLSLNGEHHVLAITEKFTTGSPHFIETGHLEPCGLSPQLYKKAEETVIRALDSLGLKLGASHAEFRIDHNGMVRMIEVGGRMGGDFIGSDLVMLTTGVDYVKAVIACAVNEPVDLSVRPHAGAAGVRFLFGQEDLAALETLRREHPDYLVRWEVHDTSEAVHDSSDRHGYFLMKADRREDLLAYLPEECGE
jgi:biotin carboxylase